MELDLGFLADFLPDIPPDAWEVIAAVLVFTIMTVLIPAVIAYLIFRIIGLAGFRRIFSYERRKSLCHEMHPLPKLVFTIFIAAGVALVSDLISLLILVALSYIIWCFSNPSRDKLRLILVLGAFQVLLIAYGQSYLNPAWASLGPGRTPIYVFPEPIKRVFRWEAITWQGFFYGLFQSLRVLAALNVAIWLITTTPPSDILYGLRRFFPLEINFMIATALKAIPTLLEKSTLVLAAERARGLRIWPGRVSNPLKAIKELGRAFKVVVTAFIPIIIESLRSGYQMGLALSTKAFRALPKRTYYRRIPVRRRDLILGLGSLLGLIYVALMGALVPA